MYPLFNAEVEKQRRQDKIALASRMRLEYQILRELRNARRSASQRMLAGLGVRLVDWGTRLQDRYAGLGSQNTPAYITKGNPTPCP